MNDLNSTFGKVLRSTKSILEAYTQVVGMYAYRVLASYTYGQEEEKALRSGRLAEVPPMTDASDVEPTTQDVPKPSNSSPAKKKSKLSGVFKVPGTTTKPSSSDADPPPTQNQDGSPAADDAPATQSRDGLTRTDEASSSAAPVIGKGKGNKVAAAFMKGSQTQQQIWKAQEDIQKIKKFLSENQVIIKTKYLIDPLKQSTLRTISQFWRF